MRLATLARLGLLLVLATPLPARAASTDAQVKKLVKQGADQYAAGDYPAAVQTLLKAYELKPVPTLLFNIARAYDKAGNADEALDYYRRFRDSQPDDAKTLAESSRAIDRLEALKRDQEAKKRADEEQRAAEQKAQADELARQKAELDRQKEEAEARKNAVQAGVAEDAPRPNRTVPYALFGVGSAAVVTGAVFGITASSAASDEKKSTDPVQKPQLRSTAHTRALVADVAYVVGLGCLAGGAAMILTEPKAAAVAEHVSPMVLDHGGGLAFGGKL